MFADDAFEKEQRLRRQREYSQALAQQVQEQNVRKQREKEFEKHGAWPLPSPSIAAPSDDDLDKRQGRGLFDNLGHNDYDNHINFARGQHRVPEQTLQQQAPYLAHDSRGFHPQRSDYVTPQLNHSNSRRDIPYDMRYTEQMIAPQPTFTIENGYHESFQNGFPEDISTTSERDNNWPETYSQMERVQSQQALAPIHQWQAQPVNTQPSGRRVRTDLRGSMGEEVMRKKQQQQDMNNALRKQIDEKNQRKEEEKRMREQEERREWENIQLQQRLKLENEEKERREKISKREALVSQATKNDNPPCAPIVKHQAAVERSYEPTFAPIVRHQAPVEHFLEPTFAPSSIHNTSVERSYEPTFAPPQSRKKSMADEFVADTQQKYENICVELQRQRQLVEEIKCKQETRVPDLKITDPNCAIEKFCEEIRRELAEREKSQLECVKNLFQELKKIPENPIATRNSVKEIKTSRPLVCESELIFNENIILSPQIALPEDSIDKLATKLHATNFHVSSKQQERRVENLPPTKDSLDFFMHDPSLLGVQNETHRYEQRVKDDQRDWKATESIKTPSYVKSLDAHSSEVSLSDEAIDAIFRRNLERYASLQRQDGNQCVQSLSTTSWQPWRLHENIQIKQ
ncbi:unnamed protein product [Albugo candida]|uniref:CCDC66 domain-containing protein n=1 Tax=Albugo candida TaxID=65357 RepID=A0A024FVH3_9STRA|nr:unnamed protein product [Albugo candida]|eukprot:CCI11125.1 unnamed protein product [Albugo candida]